MPHPRAPSCVGASFASELPKGKLPARDLAVVYLAPELLAAAHKQKGPNGAARSIAPTPESDTFAFAKVG